MPIRPEFYPGETKALIPRGGYKFSWRGIAVLTAIFVGMVPLVGLSEGGSPARYVAMAGALLLLLPLGLGLAHRRFSKMALELAVAMDSRGIVFHGMFRPIYVRWSSIKAIARVRSMLGPSDAPIDFNLLLFRKRGWMIRVGLPELTASEHEQLADILAEIARMHGIELVFDETDQGQRWLRQAPWF